MVTRGEQPTAIPSVLDLAGCAGTGDSAGGSCGCGYFWFRRGGDVGCFLNRC